MLKLHKTFKFFLALILIVPFLVWPQPVSACSCVMPSPPATAFGDADAVFVGRVTGGSGPTSFLASWLYSILPFGDSFYGRSFYFQVNDSYKGVNTTSVTVKTGFGGGDCGISFTQGQEYLVYAYGVEGSLYSGICTRTMPMSHAAGGDDMTYLSTLPTLPLKSVLPPQTFCFVSIILLAGLLLIVYRRRRKGQVVTEDGDLSV